MAPVRYRALPEPVTLLPPQTSSRLAPPPTCVALSGDGTRAAVGVGSSLYVLDLTKEDKSASQAKELFRKDLPDKLHCVAFSADDSIIAAGDAFGRCHVFHGHHGNSVNVFPHVRPERLLNKSDDDLALMELAVNGLAFSSDTLATCGADGGVSLWRLACGTRQRELYAELLDDPDDDERSEADKARDRRVLGWLSPEMRTMLKPAPAPAGYICACFCGDNSLVVGGERDELHVWVSTGEWAATPPEPSKQLKGHDQWVVSISYNNETLASLDVAGLLILWKDFVQTKQLCVGATGASVHLSEKWLITGGDSMVKVWDLLSFTCRQSFKAHELQIIKTAVAFDKEGEGFQVATLGGDRRTLLWRMDQEALCGECVLMGLSGHAWRDDPEAEVDDVCVVGSKLVTTDRAKLRLRVFDGDGRSGKTCTNEKTGSTRPPSRFEVIASNNETLVTICEEGRCSTWTVEDDFTLTRSWAYHGDLRPRSVCATWTNGPVCSCDVAGKLIVVDPSTGGLLNDFDGFESNDGGWAYADLGGIDDERSWCLCSHRGTRLVAFDPEENEAYDLVELPGHCGTIQKVDCCGVPSVSFFEEKQLRVVALGSGGVAFAWAPTAEVDGLKTRGGLVELALPPGVHDGSGISDHSGHAADRAVQRVIDAVKDRRQGVHRAHVQRMERAAEKRKPRRRVDLIGVSSFVHHARHCVLGWSQRRVGVWFDDDRKDKDRATTQRIKYRLRLVADFDARTRIQHAYVLQSKLYVVTRRGWLHRIDVGEVLDDGLPVDEAVLQRRRSSMMVRGRLSGRQVAWEELEEPSSHDDANEGDASPPKVNSNLSSLMRFSEKRRETRQADFASIARARATRRSIKPGRPSVLRRGVQQGRLAVANAPVARTGAQVAPRARRESAVIRAGRLADEALGRGPALEEIGEGSESEED